MVFGKKLKTLRRKLSRDKGSKSTSQTGEPQTQEEFDTNQLSEVQNETPKGSDTLPIVVNEDEEDSKDQGKEVLNTLPVDQVAEPEQELSADESPTTSDNLAAFNSTNNNDDNNSSKPSKIEQLKQTILAITAQNAHKNNSNNTSNNSTMKDGEGMVNSALVHPQKIIHEYPIIDEQLSNQIQHLMEMLENKRKEYDNLNQQLQTLEDGITQKIQFIIPELDEQIEEYQMNETIKYDKLIEDKNQLIVSTLNQLSEWQANNIIIQRESIHLDHETKLLKQKLDYEKVKLEREQQLLFVNHDSADNTCAKNEPTVTPLPPPPAEAETEEAEETQD